MHPHRLQGRCLELRNIIVEHDRLTSLILAHWSHYQPKMLRQMKAAGQLQHELKTTAAAFADLLYQLISVQKMEYHQAWELAIHQMLMPEESSSTSQSSLPATSGSPKPTESGWAARMRRRSTT